MWFLHEGTDFAEPKTLCVLQNILNRSARIHLKNYYITET